MKQTFTIVALLISLNVSAQVIDTNIIAPNGSQVEWIFPANMGVIYDSTTFLFPPMTDVVPLIANSYVSSNQLHVVIVNSAFGCDYTIPANCPIRRLRGYIGLYSYYH